MHVGVVGNQARNVYKNRVRCLSLIRREAKLQSGQESLAASLTDPRFLHPGRVNQGYIS